MEIHTIKTQRQNNGLWGSPLCLKHLDFKGPIKENQELLSAIIIAFAENKKPSNMVVEVYERFFCVHTESSVHNYSYDAWGLDGNELYFLHTDEDKILFNRMMKIKKIKNGK